MSDIKQTISDVLTEYGDSLLDNPLRLEAFLRDLHHDKPKEISCFMEVIHSGVLQYISTQTPRDCQLMLAQKGGLTPVAAEWAIDTWIFLWKQGIFRLEQKDQVCDNQNAWRGSVEDVLGSHRGGGKEV